MTTPGQTVGQRVRLARTARGRGVNELDRLIGSKQGYVSRLESSDREPRADTLRKLAQALGVSLEWLATGEGTMAGGGATAPVPAPTLAAAAASAVNPTPPGPVVVYDDDDPYPNRSRALALLGHNLDPRARAVLLSYRFRSGGGRDDDLPLEL
ncbi:MAG TPA: helix-turn-helix transcriptional regulator, partial [Polyangiaceae bacterium]|nr:helix-turn-helix transcriptional regulator [Polyangiaceae bacterium]